MVRIERDGNTFFEEGECWGCGEKDKTIKDLTSDLSVALEDCTRWVRQCREAREDANRLAEILDKQIELQACDEEDMVFRGEEGSLGDRMLDVLETHHELADGYLKEKPYDGRDKLERIIPRANMLEFYLKMFIDGEDMDSDTLTRASESLEKYARERDEQQIRQ